MQPRTGRQSAYCARVEKLVIEIAVAAPTAKIVIRRLMRILASCPYSRPADS